MPTSIKQENEMNEIEKNQFGGVAMLCHAVLAHFYLAASEYPKSSGLFLMFNVLLLLCMLVHNTTTTIFHY